MLAVGLQGVVSLAGGFFGAFIAAHLALQHYFKQRVWDRRAEAYTAVFDALERMADVCRTNANELMRGVDPSKEVEEARLQSYRSAQDQLKTVLGRETWIISDKVRERLVKYQRRGRVSSAEGYSWTDYVLGEQDAIETVIDDLRMLARQDMHVR